MLVIGGAGYYAWRQGWLVDVEAWVRGKMGQGTPAGPENAAGGLPKQAAHPLPAKLTLPAPQATKEEKILWTGERFVSKWAKRGDNMKLAASIMWQESRGNPNAVSKAGALGLMQVMPKTGKWLHDSKGYGLIEASREKLLTPQGSIYFGTAYLEYLDSIRGNRSLEWFIRAYNGGPKGATDFMNGTRHSAENDGYYKAVFNHYNQLTGKGILA